jgi:hypothetical protein
MLYEAIRVYPQFSKFVGLKGDFSAYRPNGFAPARLKVELD